jgi:arginase
LLGGDHSLAIGSVAGISRYCAENKKNLAILWLDAHADFNSADTSPSGNIHGMPAAVIQGVGHPDLVKICQSQPMFVKPVELIQVGIRSVDAAEKLMLNQSTVKVFDMRLIDEIGVRSIMERALGIISKIKSVHLHVSFDIDFLDPTIAPGVATTVSGGVNYREAQLMMEMIHDSGLASSLDIVELNSAFDDHNKTANLTVELIESFFGKQVLARNPARSLLDTND